MKAVKKIQQETGLDWDVPRLKEELDRLAQDGLIYKAGNTICCAI